ncbi:UNVERIFIED_CONTAM: hypothetical protein Slati_3880800, partial [Sesamum latifolium]
IKTPANEWNEPLILAEFCSEDAECILGIKLRGAEVSDEVIWHFEKKGNFSVKSAYRLAVELKDEGNASMHTGKWNFIWHSKAARKVVLFSWRSAHDVLPTSQRLLQRGVTISEGCGSCLADHEDVMHVLFFCSFARLVWAISGLPWGVLQTASASVEQWFSRVNYDLERAEWDFFLTICWALWWTRNQRIFEGKRIEAHVVHRLACHMSGFTGGSVGFEGG